MLQALNNQTSPKKAALPEVSRTTYRLKHLVPVYEIREPSCAVTRYLDQAPVIHSASDVLDLFGFLSLATRESFYAIHLDTKNRILCLDQVSVGSLSASIVHPREVFKSALLSSAAGMVFVHNHPSGDPTPSAEDHKIHRRLIEAGELLGIRVLDHLIIGRDGRHVCLEAPTGEDVFEGGSVHG